MAEIMKYVKRPIEVEAIRWWGPGIADGKVQRPTVDELVAWGCRVQPTAHWGGACNEPGCEENYDLAIPTLEGEMTCRVGDWIIRGVAGEFYPCKNDIFEMTYELSALWKLILDEAVRAPETEAEARGIRLGG